MYNLAAIREEFPVLSRCIYLDSASTSQTPRCAVEAMDRFFYEYAANHGRGAHHLARRTTNEYERTRDILGRFLNVPSDHLVFTKNTTDSINTVAHGVCWEEGDEVITTSLEHHANFLPWMALKDRGVTMKVIPHHGGVVSPETLQEAISSQTRLVAITHMTNVLGTVQPIDEMTAIAHDAGARILVDAAQSVGHMPFDCRKIDFLAMPGHKGLLGPQGTGALYILDFDSLSISCHGGGIVEDVSLESYTLLPPPARFEPGTPNIPGVIGLGRAIELVNELGVENIHTHEVRLGSWMREGLLDIDGVSVYSPPYTTVISFNIEGMDPHTCASKLDEMKGICVRSGMHCSQPLTSSLHPAGTVRASIGCYTGDEEVQALVECVRKLAEGTR
ncbi:MAG TPA: cysteine desulfurase [Methanoregulaceae archaeon]|nr:cysteine desulfurase [Methanoregulaceae archaeon]